MRILLVGGRSTLARALRPVLGELAEVVTAGPAGCDAHLDLSAAKLVLPQGIDVVINTAAAFGGKTGADLVRTEDVNVLGALRLCQAASEAGVKQLVLISSIFAVLKKDSPFFSAYALSKRHAEEAALLHAAATGLPVTILRPSQFYGVGDGFRRHQPFLFSLMDKAQRNEDIVLYGANDAQRNFIHIDDVARAVALTVRRNLLGTYACQSPENVRFSQIAAAAISAFGSTSTVRFAKDKPDVADNVFDLDDSLFRSIDYYPRISIAAGMQMEAAHRAEKA